jgi:hypothetical protein
MVRSIGAFALRSVDALGSESFDLGDLALVSDFVVLLSASLTVFDFAILDLDVLPDVADGLCGVDVRFDLVVEGFGFAVALLLPVSILVDERVTRLFGSGASEGSTDLRRLGAILASCSPWFDSKMQCGLEFLSTFGGMANR